MEGFSNSTSNDLFSTSKNDSSQIISSLSILYESVPSYCILIASGFAGLFACFLTIGTIFHSDKLRTRYYRNNIQIAFANSIVCTVVPSLSIKKLTLLTLHVGEVSTVARCSIDMGASNTAALLSLLQNFCLACDRLVAITIPNFYNEIYADKAHLLNLSMWLLGMVISLIAHLCGLNNPEQIILVCTKVLVYNDWGLKLMDNIFIAIVIITTTVNIATLIRARLTRKSSVLPSISTALLQRRQNRLLKTMTFVVLSDLILWALTNQIVNRMLTVLSPGAARLFGPYTAVTYVIQPILNLIFYTWIDVDFRWSIMKFSLMKFLLRRP